MGHASISSGQPSTPAALDTHPHLGQPPTTCLQLGTAGSLFPPMPPVCLHPPSFLLGVRFSKPLVTKIFFLCWGCRSACQKQHPAAFPSDPLAKREYLMVPHFREGWSTDASGKWTQGAIPTLSPKLSCSELQALQTRGSKGCSEMAMQALNYTSQ